MASRAATYPMDFRRRQLSVDSGAEVTAAVGELEDNSTFPYYGNNFLTYGKAAIWCGHA
jgi:hypothetical protein